MPKEWEKVGVVGVDAGVLWLGDPCYVLHVDPPPTAIGGSWAEFCARLGDRRAVQFDYDRGHPGLGVVVSAGYGDGLYGVEVRRTSDGAIAAVRVVFVDEEE